MKYTFFNDRHHALNIHPDSSTKRTEILPQETLEIEVPDNSKPFIKVWHDLVLLSYIPQPEFISGYVKEECQDCGHSWVSYTKDITCGTDTTCSMCDSDFIELISSIGDK